VGLPSGTTDHDVALGETGDVRGNHVADGAALHDVADADRLGVRRSIAHAAPHVRIRWALSVIAISFAYALWFVRQASSTLCPHCLRMPWTIRAARLSPSSAA
jgi:hypothetical protein